MDHYYCYTKGVIFTQRVWKLVVAGLFIFMMAWIRRSMDQAPYGLIVMQIVGIFTFLLTFYRAHRRSFYDPESVFNARWNVYEVILFFAGAAGFVIFALAQHLHVQSLFAYLNAATTALLIGIAIGEWAWHNTHLKELDKEHKERYWVHYKDSLWR